MFQSWLTRGRTHWVTLMIDWHPQHEVAGSDQQADHQCGATGRRSRFEGAHRSGQGGRLVFRWTQVRHLSRTAQPTYQSTSNLRLRIQACVRLVSRGGLTGCFSPKLLLTVFCWSSSADTQFSLSLNGSELLSDTGQTLSSCGIVSGDLVCVILPQSAAEQASSSTENTSRRTAAMTSRQVGESTLSFY